MPTRATARALLHRTLDGSDYLSLLVTPMLFVSFSFVLLFLPITMAGFFLLSSKLPQASIAFLALMSLVFFTTSGGNPLLLVVSVVANYSFGNLITDEKKDAAAKRSLILALIFNLGILSYYKYANWFIDNLSVILGRHIGTFGVILPVGISFFTFTQIAFLVDCYSVKVRETKFVHYLLFVTFFPHLIAGPILHHSEMMPQFAQADNKKLVLRNCVLGLLLFVIGAYKKLLFADGISSFVSPVFDFMGFRRRSEKHGRRRLPMPFKSILTFPAIPIWR